MPRKSTKAAAVASAEKTTTRRSSRRGRNRSESEDDQAEPAPAPPIYREDSDSGGSDNNRYDDEYSPKKTTKGRGGRRGRGSSRGAAAAASSGSDREAARTPKPRGGRGRRGGSSAVVAITSPDLSVVMEQAPEAVSQQSAEEDNGTMEQIQPSEAPQADSSPEQPSESVDTESVGQNIVDVHDSSSQSTTPDHQEDEESRMSVESSDPEPPIKLKLHRGRIMNTYENSNSEDVPAAKERHTAQDEVSSEAPLVESKDSDRVEEDGETEEQERVEEREEDSAGIVEEKQVETGQNDDKVEKNSEDIQKVDAVAEMQINEDDGMVVVVEGDGDRKRRREVDVVKGKLVQEGDNGNEEREEDRLQLPSENRSDDGREQRQKSVEAIPPAATVPDETQSTSRRAETKEVAATTEAAPSRKRRWTSRKPASAEDKVIAITTDSLKGIIEDVRPVSLADVKLDSEEPMNEDEETRDESQANGDVANKVAAAQVETEQDVTMEEGEVDSVDMDDEQSRDASRKKAKLMEVSARAQSPPAQPPVSHRKVTEAVEETTKNEPRQLDRKVSVVNEKEGSHKASSKPSKPEPVPPSNILYITNLVRPFTVLQLRGLLARTGKIVENGFWMDKIKSKCYVQFETEDEAVETRHALHGVRWPVSNPKCLHVVFGTEVQMQKAIESTAEDGPRMGSDRERTLLTGGGGDRLGVDVRDRRELLRPVREWDVGKKGNLDDGESRKVLVGGDLDQRRNERERREVPAGGDGDRNRNRRSPQLKEGGGGGDRRSSISPDHRGKVKNENEPPVRLLDDLFRKTKTTPCIYWLPLTTEQIAIKEEARRKHMAEHQRRMEEIQRQEKEREEERRKRDKERRVRNRSNDRDRERRRSNDRDRRRSRSRDDRRRYR